ncbi:MAG: hypothetical protein G01um10148_997 [Parcubacteria group bacterium Gr01-1014_8]|nr:MAG: hypothetical protein G01um10148_997 [Parcubacteria group bacterium Gr01-1014_8]
MMAAVFMIVPVTADAQYYDDYGSQIAYEEVYDFGYGYDYSDFYDTYDYYDYGYDDYSQYQWVSYGGNYGGGYNSPYQSAYPYQAAFPVSYGQQQYGQPYAQYTFSAYQFNSPYQYTYNASPTGDYIPYVNEPLCDYPGYGRYSCSYHPSQPIYDYWTGTWY